MIGRSVASAMRLKWASAISGDCCSVNGAGGNDEQRRGAAISSHTCDARGFERAVGPDAVDDGQPGADLVLRDRQYRRCSSKVQEATSVECALMVMAEIPSVAPTSRRWLRKLASSMERSSWNGSSTAGMTPWGTKVACRGIFGLLKSRTPIGSTDGAAIVMAAAAGRRRQP